MVYYRKYRPQTISELDLESVREKLLSILSSPNIPHAFLFTGTKGLGKTSSARILAKAVNCEKRATSNKQLLTANKKSEASQTKSEVSSQKLAVSIEPCNECSACVSITNGSNIDVIEIDAASNRGIDEIRDLREKVKFSPSSLTKKVYIIDEVHMLTTEAFNALLKTLEEPPSHVMFILCTTESWKLPGTIVSRTFHLQFEKPTATQIVHSLSRIVEGEKLTVEDGVLLRVAELSDGAFRDGAKILEELALAAGSNSITIDLLEKAYKTESIDQEVRLLLSALYAKDAKAALTAIQKMTESGCDAKVVTEKCVELLRHDMLAKTGLEKAEGRVNVTVADINDLLKAFNEAYILIKNSVIPSLPLELLAVKWCVLDQAAGIMNQESRIKEKLQNSSSSGEKRSREVSSESSQSLVHGSQKSPPLSSPTRSGIQGTTPDLDSAPNVGGLSMDSLDSRFRGNDNNDLLKNLIEQMKKENMVISGVLRSTRLGKVDDESVEIIAPFKFHGDKLRDVKVMPILEKHIATLLGKNATVKISVQEGK